MSCFTACFMNQQLSAGGAPALSWNYLLSRLMQEELAERRRFEQNQRQRLKQKSQGKEQDATPGTADASQEPASEEREVLSTPSLPDLDGR